MRVCCEGMKPHNTQRIVLQVVSTAELSGIHHKWLNQMGCANIIITIIILWCVNAELAAITRACVWYLCVCLLPLPSPPFTRIVRMQLSNSHVMSIAAGCDESTVCFSTAITSDLIQWNHNLTHSHTHTHRSLINYSIRPSPLWLSFAPQKTIESDALTQ